MTPTHEQTSVQRHLADATDEFSAAFGRSATHAAAAPGRVNLIGEHTDYNEGFVLPIAIERETILLAAPREDRLWRVVSLGQDEAASVDLARPIERGEPAWADYVRGVVAGFLDACGDATVPGLDVLISSTVPLGGGLSSSASLEVATATLLEAVIGVTLDPTAKALLAQQAEHRFAGVPCGIMDQFIAVFGRARRAMLLDCRTQTHELVPLDDPTVAVLVFNTCVKHELTGGEYAQRREQCETAARALGLSALRDATLEQLARAASTLDPLALRRARHVISEIDRTLAAAERLAAADWPGMGALMNDSHASLRDDFEVSCPELDLVAATAQAMGPDAGVHGCRMTGGGFGGCCVALVDQARAADIGRRLAARYQEQTGVTPAWFVTRPADGAQPLALP